VKRRPLFAISATGPTSQCQRPGCSRVASLRKDMNSKRTMFLCDPCFITLHAYQIRDLFQEFGLGVRRSKDARDEKGQHRSMYLR
jgi:hypothetical protein